MRHRAWVLLTPACLALASLLVCRAAVADSTLRATVLGIAAVLLAYIGGIVRAKWIQAAVTGRWPTDA